MNFLYSPPYGLKLLTRRFLCWQVPAREKNIYLTFDDGPTPGVTDEVLKILAHYQARATFFVLGKNAQKFPDMIDAIDRGGHSLGNHGYDHLNGWKTSVRAYLQNAERFPLVLEEPLFRPPYGRITPSQARQLIKRGYKIIMWSVLSRDYEARLDPHKALQKIIALTRKGSILVFHDSVKAQHNCLSILPRVLDHFAAQGFSFQAINGKS